MSTLLHSFWLSDQRLSLAAAYINGIGVSGLDSYESLAQLAQATKVINNETDINNLFYLNDVTLAQVSKIPIGYLDVDVDDFPDGCPLRSAVLRVENEISFREKKSSRMSAIHISHAVYLLRQQHLTIRDFLKWLRRSNLDFRLEINELLQKIELPNKSGLKQVEVELDRLLEVSRCTDERNRDRIDAIDDIFKIIDELPRLKNKKRNPWWLNICLALRNSMYCWPLMIAGEADNNLHGISLPAGLFLSRDGKEQVYFEIINSKLSNETTRRFKTLTDDSVWMAGIEGSRLRWDRNWSNAFKVGLKAAKSLWRTQNGRFVYANQAAADDLLTSSLVVDMGPACEIVDSVFGNVQEKYYDLTGRSAEAYWVQVVLGMLLPEGKIPFGVVTGCINDNNGAFEIGYVDGISKKLEYANNAGFSRVILPGDEQDERQAAGEDGNLKRNRVIANVMDFQGAMSDSERKRKMEINFCNSSRSAADAMQPSGWRRAVFIRLPKTQIEFSKHLNRLFLDSQVRNNIRLSEKDLRAYKKDPWSKEENAAMSTFDMRILSKKRTITFIDRTDYPDAEVMIGTWLAWKDHQVRSGANSFTNQRAPGLGVVCLRTTDSDNEMRVWSMIADTMSASSEWWTTFQWSHRNNAARCLADLLNNRRASVAISAISAPDLLVFFDEGNFTQKRTNNIFPNDFRGQFLDLLNPCKNDRYAEDPLSEALSKHADTANGCLGPTRILVIYGKPKPFGTSLKRIPPELVDSLQRLSIFRFGFSIQAAHSMLNYGRESAELLNWLDVRLESDKLIRGGAMFKSRGLLYLNAICLLEARKGRFWEDPKAHLHAAKALTPILDPHTTFVSSNRDRVLEPEPLLESMWHLKQTRRLTQPRDTEVRPECIAALTTLTMLRPYPDWDTVKGLQRSKHTKQDAMELGDELLNIERSGEYSLLHTSRIAAQLNAIGNFADSIKDNYLLLQNNIDYALRLLKEATQCMHVLTLDDTLRQKRKLFSEFSFCMQKLKVSNSDVLMAGTNEFLLDSIKDILDQSFFDDIYDGTKNIESYPISKDWLKAKWSDTESDLVERSMYAYVACRLYSGKVSNGTVVQDPWSQPWIEYFAITSYAEFSHQKIETALFMWQEVWGRDVQSQVGFGAKVRGMWAFKSGFSNNKENVSWWRAKTQLAINNIWEFITLNNVNKRLFLEYQEIAIRFISSIVMHETLPAFQFMEGLHESWNLNWARIANSDSSRQWRLFATDVIVSHAGWISTLSKINVDDRDSIPMMEAWLNIFISTNRVNFKCHDPENLLGIYTNEMEIVSRYRYTKQLAVWNGYQLIARSTNRGWAIYGHLRVVFFDALKLIDGQSNSWFFEIAKRNVDPRLIQGVCFMLADVTPDQTHTVCSALGLNHLRVSFLRNISLWKRFCNGEAEWKVFDFIEKTMQKDALGIANISINS